VVLCLHVVKNFSAAGRVLYDQCISLLVRKMDWIAVRSHRLVSIGMKNALFQSCIDECIIILLLRFDYNVGCKKNVMPKHLGVIGGTKTNISGPATICWKSFLAMPQTISVEAPRMDINP